MLYVKSNAELKLLLYILFGSEARDTTQVSTLCIRSTTSNAF